MLCCCACYPRLSFILRAQGLWPLSLGKTQASALFYRLFPFIGSPRSPQVRPCCQSRDWERRHLLSVITQQSHHQGRHKILSPAVEAPTYQLHSGGTSLVSSSRDFSDLYSWQEAHQMCCSKGGTPTRQVPIMSLVPHPDGISGCTHLDEANSHHDQHGLEERVPGREDVSRTFR